MDCEVSSRHQGLEGCDPEDLEAVKWKGHCTGNDEYEFGGYEPSSLRMMRAGSCVKRCSFSDSIYFFSIHLRLLRVSLFNFPYSCAACKWIVPYTVVIIVAGAFKDQMCLLT